MENNAIFTINVTIPDEEINDLDRFDLVAGTQMISSKEGITKNKYRVYAPKLMDRQRQYAEKCNADYLIFDDASFTEFKRWFTSKTDMASTYDVIGFYKHYLMNELAKTYDNICYFDLDVVPNTDDNIFDVFDFSKFWLADSTLKSRWGRSIDPKYFTGGSKDPASKWIQAAAMADKEGLERLDHTFNTGIMFGGSEVIQDLYSFDLLDNVLELMFDAKAAELHENYIRSFGFDNETFISHQINSRGVEYGLLDKDWHCTVMTERRIARAKMLHVMDKDFEKVL